MIEYQTDVNNHAISSFSLFINTPDLFFEPMPFAFLPGFFSYTN